MANFAFVRGGGVWGGSTVLLSSEMAAFDAIRPKLINASEGSTHAPSAPIIIGGSGIDITGPAILNDIRDAALTNGGILVLQSGTSIDGQSGSYINVSGALSIESGGAATVQSGGTLTWSGATSWPTLSSRTITRRGWRIAWTSYVGGTGTDPGTPRAWSKVSNVGSSGAPAIQTREETALVGTTFLVELTGLPPGATLNTVTIKTMGTAGDSAVNLPTYQLIRWRLTDAAQAMSASTTDQHTGTDWLTDVVDTVVTCNANQVIDGAYSYGVNVRAPYGTTAAAMQMYSFTSSLTATSIQL